MSLSSTKNLLTTSFLFLTSLSYAPAVTAATPSTKYSYDLGYDVRYGVHTVGRPDAATHRHTMEYDQKADYNNQWSTVLGLRAEVEAAYASVPDRYSNTDVLKYESQSFFPKDNYLQYKDGRFRARAGYQQIVWGEAFGLYYADIVNPKDYRNAGLGDLSRNRLDSPLINLQWINSDSSWQVLYIPKPMFSLLPSAGSDFNLFQLPATAPAIPVTIERYADKNPTQGEYGLRYSQQINGFDFSFFYLNYFDRTPVYQITTQFVPTLSLKATPEYKPLQSAGATLTVDFTGYLVRSEIVQHLNREYNTYNGTTVSSEKSDELVYVLGLDLPPRDKWQIGFQYSESRLKTASWLLRKSTQSTLAAHVGKTFRNDVVFDSVMTYYTSDSSQLLQASLGAPLSSQSEISIGADRFDGKSDTELGRFKNASRAWVMFKTTLKK